MKIFVKEIQGTDIAPPIQGTEVAAGYDITAATEPNIVGITSHTENGVTYYSSVDYIEYRTNLSIAPELANLHTLLLARSSISKYNLTLANGIGLIDNDYRGELLFRFKYTFQPEDLIIHNQKVVGVVNPKKIYKKGDRIGQLLAEETIKMEFGFVKSLPATARNEGGFGSTNSSTTPAPPAVDYGSTTVRPKIQIPPDFVETASKQPSLSELYKQSGGVPIKTPYSEEIKKRAI